MSDSQRLRAIIEGDARGAVRAFDQVADGAEKMGRDVDKAAKQSGRSLKDFQQAGVQAGQGLALLGGAFALASRNMVANERQSALLTRQYGDQADGLRELADEIQRTTTFSDEQATQAINSFATLQRNYGLTAEQIEQLTRVTVDLAAATGFELNDAAMRVQAAIRGEGEAAEALGLTMNQQSIDRENLTLTMSNQEAAQFRLNALLEQTAFAEGAAAERAATTAGQTEQLANRVQDATQRFVQFTGPIGEVAGSLGSFGLEAGLAAGGLIRLGQGLATAAPLLAGLATGPVGLGVLAVGAAAAGAAFLLLRDDTDKFAEGAEIAEQGAKDLATALEQLSAAGDPGSLELQVFSDQLAIIGERMTSLIPAAADAERVLRVLLEEPQIIQSEAELITAIGRVTIYRERVGEAEDAARTFGEAETALGDIFTHNGPGQEAAIANLRALRDAHDAGTISDIQYAAAIIATAEGLDEFDRHVIAATASTEELTGSMREVVAISEHGTRVFAELTETTAKSTHETQRGAQSAERAGGAIDSISVAAASADARLAGLSAQTAEFNENLEQATADAIAFVAEADNIDDVLLKAGKTLSGEQGLIRISQDVDRARSNLQSAFDVIAGGADALGQPIQAAAGFIDDLTASTSYLDTTLKSGRITQEDYNAVLAAEETIVENNAAAQAHLDAIRAKQAPFIAEQADAYEDYLQTLSELPAKEQQQALAFADSGEKAKIATAFATAYAVELGEIPADVATEMIVSDAQADPILKDILLEYGLIEEGANGEITVNFEDGPTLTQTLADLTTAIENLNLLIAEPQARLDTSDFDAKYATLEMEITDVDGTIIDTTANLDDNASGQLRTIGQELTNLDGRTANTTVTNTIVTREVRQGLASFFQHGGVVPHAQHGLVTRDMRQVIVGESGPELATLPGGTHISPSPASRLARGGPGGGPINIYAPVYIYPATADVGEEIRAALTGAGR